MAHWPHAEFISGQSIYRKNDFMVITNYQQTISNPIQKKLPKLRLLPESSTSYFQCIESPLQELKRSSILCTQSWDYNQWKITSPNQTNTLLSTYLIRASHCFVPRCVIMITAHQTFQRSLSSLELVPKIVKVNFQIFCIRHYQGPMEKSNSLLLSYTLWGWVVLNDQ